MKRLFKDKAEQTSRSDVKRVDKINKTESFEKTLKHQIDNRWANAIQNENPSFDMSRLQIDPHYFEQHE